MPHESFVDDTIDCDSPSPLPPLLDAKLYAKHHSQRQTRKVNHRVSFAKPHTGHCLHKRVLRVIWPLWTSLLTFAERLVSSEVCMKPQIVSFAQIVLFAGPLFSGSLFGFHCINFVYEPHLLIWISPQGDLARGLSIIDHDLDEEDSASALLQN